jgi:two-component system chemotaxis response regulator CheB
MVLPTSNFTMPNATTHPTPRAGLEAPTARKTTVMIVDDSSTMRAQIGAILGREPDIEVVGEAPDPVSAVGAIARCEPDVLTLDIEMPRMDGLTFLRKLMASRPLPVVMVSSHTQKGADLSIEAIRSGAVAVVGKPVSGAEQDREEFATTLVEQVRAAAACRLNRLCTSHTPSAVITKPTAGESRLLSPILIGASTGGTDALRWVLSSLPADAPPIAIAQHMPPQFTASFAARLDKESALTVKEAEDGEPLRPGVALLAPGDSHMTITGTAGAPLVAVRPGPRVNNARPSVDMLFESAARVLGNGAVGVILSGMGDDGARGLRSMRDAGAATFAQDEASCVIYGMPRAAGALGGVGRELSLDRIPQATLQAAVSG